jgi:hypothetical protein
VPQGHGDQVGPRDDEAAVGRRDEWSADQRVGLTAAVIEDQRPQVAGPRGADRLGELCG